MHRRAWLHGNPPARYADGLFDAERVTAFPVPELELRRVRQDAGQIKLFPHADGREAHLEAPVAADTPPEATDQLDAEPDLEGVVASDDPVVLVLVVNVDDVGIPVSFQVPGGQLDLGPAVKVVAFAWPAWGLCRGSCPRVNRHERSPLRNRAAKAWPKVGRLSWSAPTLYQH